MKFKRCALCGHFHTAGLRIRKQLICFSCEQALLLHPLPPQKRRGLLRLFA